MNSYMNGLIYLHVEDIKIENLTQIWVKCSIEKHNPYVFTVFMLYLKFAKYWLYILCDTCVILSTTDFSQ